MPMPAMLDVTIFSDNFFYNYRPRTEFFVCKYICILILYFNIFHIRYINPLTLKEK